MPNALAPQPKNALARQTDSIPGLLSAASEYPQYGALVDYLSGLRMMPPISYDGGMGSTGEFVKNSIFGNELPKTGVVKLNYSAGPDTVVHELTHAADSQITNEYYRLTQKQRQTNLTPIEQQFMAGYERLKFNPNLAHIDPNKYPRSAFATRLAPQWAEKNKDYRASENELSGWGMGATVNSEKSRQYAAPQHLDPTMATEFSILLDMATRLQKTQPVTDKR